MTKPKTFAFESDLCAAFIAAATMPELRGPDRSPLWAAYAETGGFDILLVRRADGFQIGIEAKLKLNAKVVGQAMERNDWHYATESGPDCRAVLVPTGCAQELAPVCAALGITVIRMEAGLVFDEKYGWWWNTEKQRTITEAFRPSLPDRDEDWRNSWFDRCPAKRITLPDYVPDVAAGASAPVALTAWKVKAIKIAVTIEIRGYVTRADFKHLQINMSRWTQPFPGWLKRDGEGRWVADRMPDFRAQHPTNYEQIKADAPKWMQKAEPIQGRLLA